MHHLGSISQWGEVSKTKKGSKSKETPNSALADSSNHPRGTRGGRGGVEGGRGGRGRGTERGGRGGRARGASAAPVNGSRKENVDVAPPSSDLWDATATATEEAPSSVEAKSADDAWAAPATGAAPSAADTAAQAVSSIIPDGVKKSWASMFAPVPVLKKAPEHVEKYD